MKIPAFNVNKFAVSPLHKEIVVPAVAVATLAAATAHEKNNRDKAENLSTNLFVISSWNILKQLFTPILPVAAGLTIFTRSLQHHDKHDKAVSITKDSLWLACGMAASLIFKKIPPKLQYGGKLFELVRDASSFTIGAVLISPMVNKYAQTFFVDKFFPKMDEESQVQDRIADSKKKAHSYADRKMENKAELEKAQSDLARFSKPKQ